jgi:hypothetical protein
MLFSKHPVKGASVRKVLWLSVSGSGWRHGGMAPFSKKSVIQTGKSIVLGEMGRKRDNILEIFFSKSSMCSRVQRNWSVIIFI